MPTSSATLYGAPAGSTLPTSEPPAAAMPPAAASKEAKAPCAAAPPHSSPVSADEKRRVSEPRPRRDGVGEPHEIRPLLQSTAAVAVAGAPPRSAHTHSIIALLAPAPKWSKPRPWIETSELQPMAVPRGVTSSTASAANRMVAKATHGAYATSLNR